MSALFHLRRKAKKIWQLRARPIWRRGLRLGVAAAIEHQHIFLRERFDTLIDVGANRGQFSLLAKGLYPHARIHAFEPVDEPAARYLEIFGGMPNVTLHRCAIGEAEHSGTMHVGGKSDDSSLLEFAQVSEIFAVPGEASRQPIAVRPLASVLRPEDLAGRVLMKIDVQGFEDKVIAGAAALLPHIDLIYVETALVELYKGQALFPEVHAQLAALGFRAIRIGHVTGSPVEPGCVADVLYARA